MSAFKQAVFDVEEKEDKVLVVSENGEVQKTNKINRFIRLCQTIYKVLKNTNAELNNKLTIEQGNEFAKEYNKKKRAEKQADANETLIRKLTAKMYKKR